MADKYAVAAGGNWSAAATWSLSDGGAGGAGAPSASENAYFSNQSGSVVVDATATCLDIDFTKGTGYAGTFSGSAALNISGSITLRSGMTRTYNGAIGLVATATGKTIQSNGVALASGITCNSSTGGWTLSDAISTTGSISVGAGNFNTAGFAVACAAFSASGTSTLTLGASVLTLTASWTMVATVTFSGASSTITVGSNSNFGGGGKTYGTVTLTAGQLSNTMTGANSFTNLSLLNTAAKTTGWSTDSNISVSGTLRYLGNSVLNRILISSSVVGTARTISVGTIDPTSNFVDFRDIVAADLGSPSSIPWAMGSSIGDCGGNSNITFTPSATQTTAVGNTASLTASTHAWTGSPARVPLPQDDVVINSAFIAGRVITWDMPRSGRSMTFTCTGNPAMTPSITVDFFGSISLAAGMTWTGMQNVNLMGRGVHTITSNGVSIIAPILINGPGATWSLNDALSIPITTASICFALNATGLTFNSGGMSVTLNNLSPAGPAFRLTVGTLNMGASTWLFSGQGGFQRVGGTVNAGTSTIIYTDISSAAKTFDGGGQTYSNFWLSGAGGSPTPQMQFTGSNTFTGEFKADPGSNLAFTAGTNTTAATWTINGCTIGSITAAGHTLTKSGTGYVSGDGMTISRSTASPSGRFFAGSHSVDGGNNAGWIFADLVFSDSAGSAVGSSTVSGVAQAVWNAIGTSASSAEVLGVSGAVWDTVGTASSSATVIGVSDSQNVFYQLVSLDEAKLHLRVYDDLHDDDISEKLLGASNIITDYLKLGGVIPSTWMDANGFLDVPPDIKMAALLALGELYKEREGSYANPLSTGVTDLLVGYRDPSLA